MALPLNVFKTITRVATTTPVGIYTAPVGYTGVVLLSQATNIGTQSHDISVDHVRRVVGVAVTTEMLKSFPVSSNDSVSLATGKLILESGDSIKVSANTNTNIKVILSILETLN
jgi:hypothetical protein